MTERYVWRDGHWRNARTGEPMDVPERMEICAPTVIPDIPEYRSPIDGKPITSRTHRRYDLEKHGCYEVDPPKKPRGYRNPRFAKKHGLPLNEEARDTAAR